MSNQIEMPSPVRHHLETKMIGEKIHGLTIKDVIGRGNTAITYEVEDKYGIPWALKLVTRESYGDRAPFREIARFAKTKDERFLVFPKEVDDWTLTLNGKTHEFILFKSRYVNGKTLRDFISSNAKFSASTEIVRYMENITAALEELQRLGFSHGDLHECNIMREVIGEGGSLPEIRYVIIDFSEAHPIQDAQEGRSKDIEYFGRHLRSFYDTILQRDILTREDEKVLNAIAHIPGLLNGTAPESLGISKASHVLDRFKDGLRSAEEVPRKLLTPFDSLSAENIANDALLADLCFIEMSWASELEKNSNVSLIGPRGCGKTMIFRRLRCKTKIAAKEKRKIERDPYIGFYLPCESLFYMRFSDLSETDIDNYKDSLILFFNMAVLAEVSSTINILPHSLVPIHKIVSVAISKLFYEEVGELWEEFGLMSPITNLGELTGYAEQVMRYIRKSIAYGENIRIHGSTEFVSRLVDIVKKEIPSLAGKYFIFFLDDYTEERVPKALQEALHPIVCERSSDLCFKISAHMFGSIYSYSRPLARDEGRNIQIINLGTAYLKRNKRRAEGKLLLRILNERFKHCEGYQGTIEEWLGKTSYPGGRTLSRVLHDESTRSKAYYHGVECLMSLCTGDYSEMIRLVGEIFQEAGIGPSSPVRKIPAAVQDRAIVNISREFLGRIRHIRPDGKKLFEVLNSFGKLSQHLLYERELISQGIDSKGSPRKDPCDLLTIYVDNILKAPPASKTIWERLQKASIFVDIGLAPSQRTVVSDRVTLRRIYCPAFRTTLTSSERLQATKDQFEYFMDKPEEFCNDYFLRVTKKSKEPTFWVEEVPIVTDLEEWQSFEASAVDDVDQVDFLKKAPIDCTSLIDTFPEPSPIEKVMNNDANYDLYIGAIGFEERTTEALNNLAMKGIKIQNAVLLEFDLYCEATERRREKFEQLIQICTSGKTYRPLNAPVAVRDPSFPERLNNLLHVLAKLKPTQVLIDCTSCPSLILSQCIKVLLNFPCHLTVLYSEAKEYFPTLDDWESSKTRPDSVIFRGPFTGVRFVAEPPILQADDIGELPVLLVLFPTFNTERTDGVLTELDPASRIWIFGKPHDLLRNAYRIDMAKSFAKSIYYPGDPWSILDTFDYRQSILALSRIYAKYRFSHRIVVMPHGSKMQTLGLNLFAKAHQLSMAFAMPKLYDPQRYSKGCIQVWGIELGETMSLVEKLKKVRILGNKASEG